MEGIHTSHADTPRRIAVIMPTWVGDVVMATPALAAMRRRFADAHIAVVVSANVEPVVRGGPWANEVIAVQPRRGLGRAGEVWRTAQQIKAGLFDWAVLLSNSLRTALMARLANVPRRIGYDRDVRGWLLTDRVPPAREGGGFAMVSAVRYYNALARRIGCDDPGETLELATTAAEDAAVDRRLTGWGIANAHPLVVVNPGASFGISKLWIPERYAEVADQLVRRRGASIVVTFGPGERGLAERIRRGMRERAYLVDDPPGTLGELKSLIARCDLLLNNDTGPRHFAKAFGRSVVTVFGSTHPEWTHTDYAGERIVRIDVDCGPCQKKVCPYAHHKCMTGVTSDMVYDAATGLLDGRGTGVPLTLAAQEKSKARG